MQKVKHVVLAAVVASLAACSPTIDGSSEGQMKASIEAIEALLACPERAAPWLTDNFNYKISSRLEPGEATTWKLTPNQFSDWGTVDAPEDAILTVEVLQLDGPDCKPLYSVRGFGETEAEQLDALLEDYPEF